MANAMAGAESDDLLSTVRALWGAGTAAGESDSRLLGRFAADRDEAAFSALVSRHGPMVLGLCRRMLADPRDAEDAFQATFLILSCKAGSLRDGDRLAPWLHGVARRVASRARARAIRRRSSEHPGVAGIPAPSNPDLERREARDLIDDEVGRLPEKYRAAVVLCYLEGRTHAEAAEALRCPVGTVKTRIAWAKDRLRARLAGRGLDASALGLILDAPPIAVPSSLAASATRAGCLRVLGPAAVAGAASQSAFLLAEGVLATMTHSAWKLAAAVALSTGLCTAGTFVLAQQGRPRPDAPATKPDDPAQVPSKLPPARRAESDEAQMRAYKMLGETIPMHFPNDTPLEKVLKYIGESTRRPDGQWLNYYVDPAGLVEAGRQLTSTVKIDVEGAPLATSLTLILDQLDLAWSVRDGILRIDAKASQVKQEEDSHSIREVEHRLYQLERKMDRILELLEQPRRN